MEAFTTEGPPSTLGSPSWIVNASSKVSAMHAEFAGLLNYAVNAAKGTEMPSTFGDYGNVTGIRFDNGTGTGAENGTVIGGTGSGLDNPGSGSVYYNPASGTGTGTGSGTGSGGGFVSQPQSGFADFFRNTNSSAGSMSSFAHRSEEAEADETMLGPWQLVGAMLAMFLVALLVFAVIRRCVRDPPAKTMDDGSQYERFPGDCERQPARLDKQFNMI